jgi:hypothetical protein
MIVLFAFVSAGHAIGVESLPWVANGSVDETSRGSVRFIARQRRPVEEKWRYESLTNIILAEKTTINRNDHGIDGRARNEEEVTGEN